MQETHTRLSLSVKGSIKSKLRMEAFNSNRTMSDIVEEALGSYFVKVQRRKNAEPDIDFDNPSL